MHVREVWDNMSMPHEDSPTLSEVTEIFPWARTQVNVGFLSARSAVKNLRIGQRHFTVGWLHDPLHMPKHRTALGIFLTKKNFVPVAVIDDHAHVYETGRYDADVSGSEPRVQLASEGQGEVYAYRFLRQTLDQKNSSLLPVQHGAVVARSEDGQLRWLSSWMESNHRYTFEQLRSPSLSKSETANVEYRTAMTLAYFAIYAQPTLAMDTVNVIGFGTSNIYRRVRNQAPLSAIRTSVDDIEKARKAGLKISGLEEYFINTMRETGAMERTPQLEARHGQENLELMTNPKSHLYYLHSRNGVDFDSALKTMRIETNLNRFSAMSSVIENNYHYDFTPTEDAITLADVARLSDELLENPAFDALSTLDTNGVDDPDSIPALRYPSMGEDATQETSFSSHWLGQFYAQARRAHAHSAGPLSLDNITHVNAVYPMVKAARETAYQVAKNTFPYDSSDEVDKNHGAPHSQWVYRRALAKLITHLRLPLRSDIDFRADVQHSGATVIDFTSTASTVMPLRRFDTHKSEWVDISSTERAQMSARYNLRVGIILAALAFGASDNIREVAVRIDNLDGSQDIEERDPTMYALLMRALDKMGMDSSSVVSSAADERKTSTGTGAEESLTAPSAPSFDGEQGSDSAPSAAAQSPVSQARSPRGTNNSGEATNDNDTFMDIMKSANFSQDQLDAFHSYNAQPTDEEVNALFDEVTREDSEADFDPASASGAQPRVSVMSGPGSDPLELIRRTALNNTVAAVIFERQKFLELLKKQGLEDPYSFYTAFQGNAIDADAEGILHPLQTSMDLRDAYFTPEAALDEPESSHATFSGITASTLKSTQARDLSIQRSDVLERAQEDISYLATAEELSVPERAQKIAAYIDNLNDPELNNYKDTYIRNVIDGMPIDRARFTLAQELEEARNKSRETFVSGNPQEALSMIEERLENLDSVFKASGRVPRYFNSYAERVVYNQLFASSEEKVVLVPDNLFQTHMEMAEVYSHLGQREAAMRHLNTAVSYAPAYPLPHILLAVMLAESQDWESSFAAASNALRVALDKDDAAFAYYRMAFAAWMQDNFEIAAACYIMSIRIGEQTIPHARYELEELWDRARSQDIDLPSTFDEATDALTYFDIDFWPFTPAAVSMNVSAPLVVDNNQFVAGRTLAAAAARIKSAEQSMFEDSTDFDNIVELQFLRSLNA